MPAALIVVDGFVPSPLTVPDNLREQVWNYALDQRAFGPRKLWVAFTERNGRFRGLAYTDRTDPWRAGFEACLDYLGNAGAAAVVFHDEPVVDGPPTAESVDRFEQARAIAGTRDVHLVDWFACDDDRFRAARLGTMVMAEQPDWWDVPPPWHGVSRRARPPGRR